MQPKSLRERAGGRSSLHQASGFSMLAKRCRGQTLPKCVACALRSELLADVAARVDEYVSHETAKILVAGDDEVPGVTRRRRMQRVLESLGGARGITEDGDMLTSMESAYYCVGIGLWSAVSVHVRGVLPDGTWMIVHSFVILLSR